MLRRADIDSQVSVCVSCIGTGDKGLRPFGKSTDTAVGETKRRSLAAGSVGSSMSVDYLDLRGEVCPMTFVHVRLWLERAPLGAELAVDVDYQPATRSITQLDDPRSGVSRGGGSAQRAAGASTCGNRCSTQPSAQIKRWE